MNQEHKLIITGTGRAGTTFLVRLLTALGQPTGYDRLNWRSDYFPHCAAGLERKLTDPQSPYIVKDPELCVTLEGILAERQIDIDHAIIPIRDLEAAALSRVRIGGSSGAVPGGIVGTNDPAQQKAVLADRFHRLMQTLVLHDIPHTFLLFPRFVQDADYAFAKLHPIFPKVARDRFDEAFRAIADPSLVHSFDAMRPAGSSAASAYTTTLRAKRRRRHLRQVGAWSSLAAAVVLALGSRWPGSAHAASSVANGVPDAALNAPGFSAPSHIGPGVLAPKMMARHRKASAGALRRAPGALRLSNVGQPDARTFTSAKGAPPQSIAANQGPEFAF